MILIGGIGRLISLAVLGLPWPPFVGFTVLEVVGAPLFIAWQRRVAQPAQHTADASRRPMQ